jgi:hypothetical protein
MIDGAKLRSDRGSPMAEMTQPAAMMQELKARTISRVRNFLRAHQPAG